MDGMKNESNSLLNTSCHYCGKVYREFSFRLSVKKTTFFTGGVVYRLSPSRQNSRLTRIYRYDLVVFNTNLTSLLRITYSSTCEE